MGVRLQSTWLVLAACVLIGPATVSAQGGGERGPDPGVPKTDQEMRGEALFYKECPLCHVFLGRSTAAHSSTELVGLFKRPSVTEDAVRQLMTSGLPGLMPSFQYSMTTDEMTDLVAYLKIR